MSLTQPPTSLNWLYVDFNSYFASVEQELHPPLRGKPVAIVPVASDSTCAIAASYEAKAYGVRTGTPIWKAKHMCPKLICVLAQHEHYTTYHHRILQEIDRHLPISAVCSIDEMACYLMENERQESRILEIAHAIKKGLARNVGAHIRCSIGIAANRYLAKVATDIEKPNGLTLLHPHTLPGRLLELDLRDLPGIGHHMHVRLLRAGISTMDALFALSAQHMRQLWRSMEGEKLWYLLRGYELPYEETTRRTLGHSHVLAPDVRAPEKASLVARRLVLKATSRLRRMQYYAQTLSLSIRLENGLRLKEQRTCYRAQDSVTFLHMLQDMWEECMRKAHTARIKKISLLLENLISEKALLDELFPALPPKELEKRTKAEQLSKAMDQINHRFGRDSITLGMLPSEGKSVSGTKIAFTHIPDREEFSE